MKNSWILFFLPVLTFCQVGNHDNVSGNKFMTEEVFNVEFDHTVAEFTFKHQHDTVHVDVSIFYHQNHHTYQAVIHHHKLLKLHYLEKENDELIDNHSFMFEQFKPVIFERNYPSDHSDDDFYLIDSFFDLLKVFQSEYGNDFKRLFGS